MQPKLVFSTVLCVLLAFFCGQKSVALSADNSANNSVDSSYNGGYRGSRGKVLSGNSFEDQGHKVKAEVIEHTGSKTVLQVNFLLEKGWKLYSNEESDLGFPLKVDFPDENGYKAEVSKNYKIKALYPNSLKIKEDIGGEFVHSKVYKDAASVPILITPLGSSGPLDKILLQIEYSVCNQTCNKHNIIFSLPLKLGYINKQKLSEMRDRVNEGSAMSSAQKIITKNGLFKIILTAILGGLIINLMPCVLPVIVLKLTAVRNARNLKSEVLQTIFGIFFCFLVLFAVTLSVQLSGGKLTTFWGKHFQNLWFICILCLMVTGFIANFLGFEIPIGKVGGLGRIANFLDKKIDGSSNGFTKNFLTGVLIALMSTPCSAPILGVAIAYAYAGSPAHLFVVMFSIAFGFCIPLLLAVVFPEFNLKLLKKFNNKPQVKQICTILMFVSLAWLCYITYSAIGFFGAICLFVLCLFALYFLKIKKLVYFLFACILIFAVPQYLQRAIKSDSIAHSNLWLRYEDGIIDKYVSEGKVVFIDITANWCINCKVNKVLVLNKDEVQNALRSEGVVAIIGDVSLENAAVEKFLLSQNRRGIPFNAVYSKKYPNGLVLPEVLTKSAVLNAIKSASDMGS